MNKKNTLSILTASVMILSVMLVSAPTVLAVPGSVFGYVYIDDVITEPSKVVLIFEGQEIEADLFDDGYYIIDFDEEAGEEGVFHVTYSGDTWEAVETLPLTSDITYPLDLHINTPEPDDGDGGDSGGGGSSGGGSSGGGSTGGGGIVPPDDDEPTDGGEVIPDNPPEMQTFEGNETGTQNTNYTYSAMATDADGHDVSYIFDWGDGSNDTTEYVANGTTYDIVHMWTSAGIYEISVHAMDDYPEEGNGSVSNKSYRTVLIDVHIINDETNGVDGYLIDDDSDGVYDNFYNNDDESTTGVEYDAVNGTYKIDTDGDGEYDYIYNPDTGTGEPIVTEQPDDGPAGDNETEGEDNTMYYIAAIVIIIVLLLLFVLAAKKRKK